MFYIFLHKAARVASKLLDVVLGLVILAMFAFGAYSMYDINSLYQDSELSDTVLQYKPTIAVQEDVLPQDNSLTFEELQKINPDVCAWISIKDTKIDYPIVASKDNMDYLNVDVMGEYSLSGSIFLDFRNSKLFDDPVSIIYGHNMNDYAMFGEIPPFQNEEKFFSHEDGTLFLPNATYALKIMAYIEVPECTPEIYNIEYTNYQPTEDYFLPYIRNEAEQFRDVSQYDGEQYLMLSTCSSQATNGRCLLVLKVLEHQNGG